MYTMLQPVKTKNRLKNVFIITIVDSCYRNFNNKGFLLLLIACGRNPEMILLILQCKFLRILKSFEVKLVLQVVINIVTFMKKRVVLIKNTILLQYKKSP